MTQTHVFKSQDDHLDSNALQTCVDIIQQGGVVVFPTDTVYGLGASAFNPQGIEKIYSLKGRDYSKPLPIFLANAHQLPLVAQEIPDETHHLIEDYWPGPLTLVLKTATKALHATRGKESIAVRVPDHGMVRTLLEATQIPLAVTSANISGQESMKTGAQVVEGFSGRADAIVDGGDCRIGTESSIVDATHYPFTVLRHGAISKRSLEGSLRI